MNTAANLSPASSAVTVAILTAMDCEAANDNAGIAFRLVDDVPDVDDYRPAVCVRRRDAKRVAPAVEAEMPARWIMYGAQTARSGGSEVAFNYSVPACRGTRRRLATVAALLSAGGLTVARGR